MKSSDRNDGPLVSLEVDLRLLAVFEIWAYVEAAFVEAFAKFGDALLAKGTFVEAWPKMQRVIVFACKFWQMAFTRFIFVKLKQNYFVLVRVTGFFMIVSSYLACLNYLFKKIPH